MKFLLAIVGALLIASLSTQASASNAEAVRRVLFSLISAEQEKEKAIQERNVLEEKQRGLQVVEKLLEKQKHLDRPKKTDELLSLLLFQLNEQWKRSGGEGELDISDLQNEERKIEERSKLLEKEIIRANEKIEEAKGKIKDEREKLGSLSYLMEELGKPRRTLQSRLIGTTSFRCKMALCWGGSSGQKFAFEPVLDLPVSLTWSMGDGALSGYINSHLVNLEFNAGLRFWFAYDIASIAVYVSEPIIKSGDPIRIDGSGFSHTSGAIHRSYPSLGFGFFGDSLLLGLSYDVLRNGAANQTQDPNYPPNEVLSRSLTFSIGFSFLNMTRNQIGRKDD